MSDTLAPARPGASPEAIMAHYDTGNEFFRLWIGPWRNLNWVPKGSAPVAALNSMI